MLRAVPLALAATVTSIWGYTACAEGFKASDLIAACQSAPGSSGDRACSIFIGGFVAGLVAQRLLQIQGHAICLPAAEDTLTASRLAIQAFVDAHPEVRDAGAPQVATEALLRAFPCSN